MPERTARCYDPEIIDKVRRLERFLARLRPKIREVFVRSTIDEQSMQEIATALGIPLKTAYSRLDLARATLARMVR